MSERIEKNLVSIVMPTYNRAYIIARSIKSVLKQTYCEWELLIVDDGSTDETQEVVSGMNDGRIRYLKSEKNMGANYARNQGLAAAKGSYIAFLDSDNVWEKNYLEERLAVLKKSAKNVGGVFGYIKKMRNSKLLGIFPPEDVGKGIANLRSNKMLIQYMLFENLIDPNAILLRRVCVESISGFREQLRRLQDWEYFFRVLYESGYRIKFVEDCLVRNYLCNDSITHRSNDDAYWEARLFFLKQYRKVFDEYGCFEEAVCQLCLKTARSVYEVDLSRENFYNILALLEPDTVKRVMELMRKEYVEIFRQNDKLQGISDYFIGINEKNNLILNMQSRWMTLMQNGVKLGTVLSRKGYKKVAIYGYGHLGRTLYRELSDSECSVLYILDKKAEGKAGSNTEIIKPKAGLRDVDAVIVTAVADYEQIREQYEREIPYISLADIIEAAEKGED